DEGRDRGHAEAPGRGDGLQVGLDAGAAGRVGAGDGENTGGHEWSFQETRSAISAEVRWWTASSQAAAKLPGSVAERAAICAAAPRCAAHTAPRAQPVPLTRVSRGSPEVSRVSRPGETMRSTGPDTATTAPVSAARARAPPRAAISAVL